MTESGFRWRGAASVVLAAIGSVIATGAQIPMPDPSEMSGIPLPSGELPNASVSVRLIRGQLSNNLTDHPVELRIAGDVREASTDQSGRALFEGLEAGSAVSVSATVDGGMLTSRIFAVPAVGGVRVMLVADGSPSLLAGAVPASSGTIVFGGDTRWIVEMSDEAVEVFYLLEAVNSSGDPVVSVTPVDFELPVGAQGAVLLEGTTSQAEIDGRHVSVAGPFRPGRTPINVAYVLPYRGGDLTIQQTVPVTVEQVAVVTEKRGDMRMTSPQITQSREMNVSAGTFLVGGGPQLGANQTLSIFLSGLPHHSPVPLRVALFLVGLVAMWWLWQSRPLAHTKDDGSQRRNLESRRERLYADLIRIDTTHRMGAIADAPYADRRGVVFDRLERLYQRLEHDTVAMPSGKTGLPS